MGNRFKELENRTYNANNLLKRKKKVKGYFFLTLGVWVVIGVRLVTLIKG